MMPDRDLKERTLNALLDLGPVIVHVDGRACSGLLSPHNVDPALRLRIGYGLTPPVQMVLGDLGISAELSFAGALRTVLLPWVAIYALVGEGGPPMIATWPASYPQADAEPVPTEPRRGLRLVD